MPRYHADGTVEMKFQSPEYEKPVYERQAPRPFALGTGNRKDPVPASAGKVTVKAVEPRKPGRAKAKPRAKKPPRDNTARDQKIIEMMKGGSTAEAAGKAVGLSKQQALYIFRQHCPDFALSKGGLRPKQIESRYGAWEVLDDRRHYRQSDGTMAPGKSTGTAYIKCRCDCQHQPFSFVSATRLFGGESTGCIHCAAARRQPRPLVTTGPLTPAEQELARSLAPPAK